MDEQTFYALLVGGTTAWASYQSRVQARRIGNLLEKGFPRGLESLTTEFEQSRRTDTRLAYVFGGAAILACGYAAYRMLT
ncbi:hypothetical protein HY642_05155 [Candidatus Woesearchaeota archaeon]|nr:hypothetical protein [Candidatus Woesearchaeota archaeon]